MENQLTTTEPKQIALVSDTELLMHLNNLGLAKELTDGERNTYLQIAKAFNLNPFKREIHVSKYNGTMSIITGYEVYIKRAERSGLLDGWECTTEGKAEDNTLKAIITIYRKDRKFPFKHEVYYSEYVGKTNAGIVTKFWQKAQTMTKKVAMSQGFRLCFSDELGGMPYTVEEMPEQTHDVDYTDVSVVKTPEPKFESTTHDKPFLNQYVFNSPGVETEDWQKVSEAFKTSKCTMEYIESRFKLSKETKEKLIELTKP